jgi:nifR3 family TIM-barrel protein
VGIQLYGAAEEYLREAVAIAETARPDFIDINCGCWAKKIAMRGEGAGLLRDLSAFERVVRTVVEATDLPVTVKTRLGWDHDDIVVLEAARIVEQAGAKALAVHCRTRNQGYQGHADWRWLARIKEVIAIPLIGNGDLETPEDFARMFETGCDGAMVGRGAICNPWVFEQAKHYLRTGERPEPPAPGERVARCIEHLTEQTAYRGYPRGLVEFRKHYRGYLDGLPGVDALRNELVRMDSLDAIVDRLRGYLDRLERAA